MGKTIVYQLLPRLWGNKCVNPVRNGSLEENGSGKFGDVDVPTLSYLRDCLGVTHVWYTGVIRHATTVSFAGCRASVQSVVKGRAGSPYAIVDYYDVNPYLAENEAERMAEFEQLLRRTHDSGLKAIIDFVPNHVSRDYGKVGMLDVNSTDILGNGEDCSVHWKPENDFYYYPGERLSLPGYFEFPAKASGNRFSPSPEVDDWYETIRINYCDFPTLTWKKMYDIVRYWCLKGVDGFRCDMVEMVPWQFMKWLVEKVKSEFPDVIFIAEVYRKELYRHYVTVVGFDLLYDKSGLYDTLRAVVSGRGSARGITWNWQMLGDLQPRMLNFLENHDEQRFASSFFGGDASKTGAPLCASMLLNTSPFMIYFGEEVGERGMDAEGFSGPDGRTSIFDWWSVASLGRLNEYVHTGCGLTPGEEETLKLFTGACRLASSPAVSQGKTFDLCYCNAGSPGFDPDRHFAFLRGMGDDVVLFVCNFSTDDASMQITVPDEAVRFIGMKKTEAFTLDVSVKGSGYLALPV